MFGTAGLPHILMRFFTVADAKAARKSVFYATGFIGYFYILTFIIGFGAIVLVSTNPAYLTDAAKGIWRSRAAPTWRRSISPHAVGGDLFLGFISAVAFATILAVVSGLTLAGASAISHDLYANVFSAGTVERARRSAGVEGRDRRAWASSRSCSASSSRSRTSPSWSASPSRSPPRATSRCCSCRFSGAA